jgi:hypothetical protein
VGRPVAAPILQHRPGHRAGPSLFKETMMDWYTSCAYAPEQKQHFHTTASARLRRLATALEFPAASYDLRSNQGGIAVSGEITLHHGQVYVQVCQPATGADSGILIRICRGRRDYTGGRNHFAPLSRLDDIPALAVRIRGVMAAGGTLCRPEEEGEGAATC